MKQCMIPGLTSCLAKEKWCLNLDLSHRVSSGEVVGGTQQIEKSMCLTLAVSSLCIYRPLAVFFLENKCKHSCTLHVFFCSPIYFPCGFVFDLSVPWASVYMSLPLHLWPMSSVLKCIPFRLQAVRVVFCCSRLQLSLPPDPCISG